MKPEKLSYRALQRIYGRSVGMRAPSKFVSLLKRKAASAGVSVTELSARTTNLSQVCLCGSMKKKTLSECWHICDCGNVAQRDLFSGFLAACVENDQLNADLADSYWRQSSMETSLGGALSKVQPTIDGRMSITFGLNNRSQRRLPGKDGNKHGELSC